MPLECPLLLVEFYIPLWQMNVWIPSGSIWSVHSNKLQEYCELTSSSPGSRRFVSKWPNSGKFRQSSSRPTLAAWTTHNDLTAVCWGLPDQQLRDEDASAGQSLLWCLPLSYQLLCDVFTCCWDLWLNEHFTEGLSSIKAYWISLLWVFYVLQLLPESCHWRSCWTRALLTLSGFFAE